MCFLDSSILSVDPEGQLVVNTCHGVKEIKCNIFSIVNHKILKQNKTDDDVALSITSAKVVLVWAIKMEKGVIYSNTSAKSYNALG